MTISAGTSIAAPILAGGIASLWSAFPEVPAAQLLDVIFATADLKYRPGSQSGYGTPNFAEAWVQLKGIQVKGKERWYGYQSDRDQLVIITEGKRQLHAGSVFIKDLLGRVCLKSYAWVQGEQVQIIEIPGLATLPHGIYSVYISNSSPFYWGK